MLDGQRFARRYFVRVEFPLGASADRDRPLVARDVGQLEVGMKADRDRHRLGAGVRDRGLHFQLPVPQAIRHLDRVGERPLLHPHRLTGELEPAGHPRGFNARAQRRDLPLIGGRKEAVNRDISAYVPEAHVERVPLAVRVERLFVQAIRPRPHEWNPGRIRLCLEVRDRLVGESQHVLSLDAHLERDVSGRRHDRDNNVGCAIGEPDDVAFANGAIPLRQNGRRKSAHEHHEQEKAECFQNPGNSVFSRA